MKRKISAWMCLGILIFGILGAEIPAYADDGDSILEESSMLNDARGFSKIYIATGYSDLRKGIDGLANVIKFQFGLDPFQKDVLFLFCGRRTDRIKGLVWEGDGFLLLYKGLNLGSFRWPRNTSEALAITPEQYGMLMQGLEIVARSPIRETQPTLLC